MTKIKQINVKHFDERFYQLGDEFVPSVTYILQCVYPKSSFLTQWIGDVGNKRAEEIRDEAGDLGTFVHDKIELMLTGGKIHIDEIDDKFKNKPALKIKRSLKAFVDWYKEYQPEIITIEHTIWNSKYQFAGTLDLHCKIKDKKTESIDEWIIDFKTSNAVHDSHRAQLSAYNYAETGGNARQAILHLGNKTKKHYSFLEVEFEKYFNIFITVNKVFQTMYPNAKPTEENFPEYFKLNSKDE